MDRVWLLTSTFYGTWLPGDRRGFVSRVRDRRSSDPSSTSRFKHNRYGTDYDGDIEGIRRHAQEQMKGPPIALRADQAGILLAQFQETATYRKWELIAVAILWNHVHLLVGVLGDPDPEDLLRDFKSYGSRALNKKFGKPMSETWWTAGGSARIRESKRAIAVGVRYIERQKNPLLIWVSGGCQPAE